MLIVKILELCDRMIVIILFTGMFKLQSCTYVTISQRLQGRVDFRTLTPLSTTCPNTQMPSSLTVDCQRTLREYRESFQDQALIT